MTDPAKPELLPAFKSGDLHAFEQVYKFYYKPLRVQAFLILKNEDDAEDQVQQLFLDIWNRQLYRNIEDSLKAYLFTAIRNRCYNFSSRDSQHRKALASYSQTLEISEQATYQEPVLRPCFQSALNELPAQRSRAFYLVHLQDKKYTQAAEEMGISINSLKSHLKLAVRFLKNKLQN